MSIHVPRGALGVPTLLLCIVFMPLPLYAQPEAATVKWGSFLGGAGNDRITGLAQLGPAGAEEVMVVGSTTSDTLTPTAGGSTVLSADAMVARFRYDGVSQYTPLRFGGAGKDEANAVAVGSQGVAYVVGSTRSDTISPTTSLINSYTVGGGDDAFLAQVNSSGALMWFMYLGGSDNDVATGVAFVNDAVYVVGRTSSTSFLGEGHVSPGGTDGFVVQVNVTNPTAPTMGWVQRIGGQGADVFTGITADWEGNLVVVGTSNAPIVTFGETRVSFHGPAPVSDAVVVKLSAADGAGQWITYLGGTQEDRGSAIVRDPLVSGQVAVVGTTSSTGLTPEPSPAQANAFVVWLNREGVTRRTRVVGGSDVDEALAATVDTAGNVYVGGKTASTDLVGANAFDKMIEAHATPSTLREGFVWAVPPEGPGWATYAGGDQNDEIAALGIGGGKRLMLAGQTHSALGFPSGHDRTLSTPPDGVLVALDVLDITSPSTGRVFDGPVIGADLATQTDRSSISANWTGLEEDVTNIVQYEWAIGTSAAPESIQPFTSIPTLQTKLGTNTSVSLDIGQTYIVTVRSKNDVGLITVIQSDGVLVTAPDGGTGGPDGGMGGPDGGMSGPDAGLPDPDKEDSESPVGWGCASAGSVMMPVLLGLLALVLLARRSGTSAR